ncbi:YkvA family protein [Pseudonocardia halophobica]|uniref:YkvA family protein n=1 Tax=Pseudonocardia halophobica TaxID=29401 RepID=UPI003D8FEC4E
MTTSTGSRSSAGRRAALLTLARVIVQSRKQGSPGLGDRARALPRMVTGALSGRSGVLTRGRLGLLVLAIAYLVSPVDLVPEALTSVFGLVDDGVVALWLGGALLVETQRFLEWERDGRPQVVDGELVG